jgi:hypothetical protein
VTGPCALELRVALERTVLRAFCGGASDPDGLTMSEAKTLLEKYVWRGPDNRVVFESLCGLSSSLSAGQLREQLPAQATRLGFPDVDWENYLTPADVIASDFPGMISRLLATE